jgi:prepilin-type N-terminal cleavage/methylation domain-containing protein
MKVTRRRSRKRQLHFHPWGFTLIEMLVIIMIVGILAAIAAPSFGSLFDSIKVSQTVTELRSSLQETQRQSIRANKICETQVTSITENGKGKGNGKGNNGNGKGNGGNINSGTVSNVVQGNCLAAGDQQLPDGVDLVTNIQTAVASSALPSSSTTTIRFVPSGSAEFSVLSASAQPSLPADPTGKLVAYISSNQQVQKKCVAISNTLGLTRIGTYTGNTDPAAITDSGVCTALDWKQQ